MDLINILKTIGLFDTPNENTRPIFFLCCIQLLTSGNRSDQIYKRQRLDKENASKPTNSSISSQPSTQIKDDNGPESSTGCVEINNYGKRPCILIDVDNPTDRDTHFQGLLKFVTINKKF